MTDIKFEIAKKLYQKRAEVDAWFLSSAKGLTLPFYNSVDIRDSGLKVVPVDNNLYPAGFNNICPEDRRTAGDVFEQHVKPGTKVLLIPEAHTQNKYYIENISYLMEILQSAGYQVELGWPPQSQTPQADTPAPNTIELEAANGTRLTAHPVFVEDGLLRTKNFVADQILLNNDFSGGYPTLFDTIRQPVTPSHHWGWHTRRKDRHFVHYNRLATELANLIGLDPWHITLHSEVCDMVNFGEDAGIDCVAAHTEWV